MKKSLIILNIFLLFFVSLVFHVQKTHAQLSSSDILLDVFPNNPNPEEEVRASVRSYATDLNRANIVWSINGRTMTFGVGRTTFSFKTGKAGETMNLSVSIETLDGQNINNNFVFSPSSVDLIWEAEDSFSPPFYKGKTLVGREGFFRIVALPNIRSTTGNTQNMLYMWKKDGKNQTTESGWGKNLFIFKNHYLDETNQIEVLVSNPSGNINASNRTVVRGFAPKIVFYKKDQTGNILYNKAIQNEHKIGEESENIVAIPYFFNRADLTSSVVYRWFLNEFELLRNDLRNEISVVGDGKGGSSTLRLVVENTKTLFQESEKSVVVNF